MALDHRDPEDLRRAYERHDTVKEAAQEFAVSYSTVRRRMIQAGIHTPRKGSRHGEPYDDAEINTGGTTPHRSEPEVFERCWRLYKQDETDLLGAGVPPKAIAEEVDTSRRVVLAALRSLQDRGIIVELHGLDPETRSARTSFAPAALVEDNGGEHR